MTRRLNREAMIRGGHYGERYSNYEFDHLIPLSLGGALRDPRNLWFEPIAGAWGASAKDDLEMSCGSRCAAAESPSRRRNVRSSASIAIGK